MFYTYIYSEYMLNTYNHADILISF